MHHRLSHTDRLNDNSSLVHLANKLVDVTLTVTMITTLDIMEELPRAPAAGRIGELEWPEEVGSLLEVRTGGEDLVYEVFDAENIVLPEGLLDDGVRGERHALLVYFAVAALVDELADGLEVRLAAEGR